MKRTGILLIGWAAISVLFLLGVEAFTLADSTPMNHVTAVVQSAFRSEPGVFMWLAFAVGYLAGHFFWRSKEV